MKFENAAIVMTDTATGKPYARPLSAWELNLVLLQLQALDGGALKAREIAPFVLHSVNVSPERAQRIAEAQQEEDAREREALASRIAQRVPPEQCLHIWIDGCCPKCGLVREEDAEIKSITDHLIGKRVSVSVGRVTHGTGKIPGGVQQIAKPQPAKACPHETVLAGVCIVCDKRVKP